MGVACFDLPDSTPTPPRTRRSVLQNFLPCAATLPARGRVKKLKWPKSETSDYGWGRENCCDHFVPSAARAAATIIGSSSGGGTACGRNTRTAP